VSVTGKGFQLNGVSVAQDISPNGRHVVYLTSAPNGTYGDWQVPGDTNSAQDVFVHDLSSGATSLASIDPSGLQLVHGGLAPDISGDGRFVAFRSFILGWVGSVGSEVYVRDVLTATTELVSLTNGGQPLTFVGACGSYKGCPFDYTPSISYDGRFVAFATLATNLSPGGNPYSADVFVRDRFLGTTTPVALTTSGALAGSDHPSLSADGRLVAFTSWAALVPGDTNGVVDAYVHDLSTGLTTRVSVDSTGAQSNGHSYDASISDDGSAVAFSSDATNLTTPDTNGERDVFTHDLTTGSTVRASLTYSGAQSNGSSRAPRTTGRLTVFSSEAINLVLSDTNGQEDAFLRDTSTGAVPVTRYCTAKTSSNNCQPYVSVAGLPSVSGEAMFRVLAQKTPTNRRGLFFWGLGSKTAPFFGGTLCVQGPLRRTPVVSANGVGGTQCTGRFSFPFDATYMRAQGISAGTTIYGQFYVYDLPPNNVGLTDGIQFTVGP